MANCKQIDIFGQYKELDFHLALEPAEGEKGLDVLLKSIDYLVSKGATARPQPGRGGFGGKGGNNQPPPNECPVCKAKVNVRDWTNKENKPLKIYKCSKDESHFKPIFKPA